MELIVISDTRMKITLSKEDMSSYNIEASTLDTQNTRVRRILCGILEEAGKRAGVQGSSERAFVRVFPSLDGGCEMYVTRFSELSDTDLSEEESCENMSNNKNTPKSRRVFCFSRMREVLRACRALNMRGYGERSDLYISKESGALYLTLFEGDTDLSVMLEYAEPVFFGGVLLYISEHCAPIAEGSAVEVMSALC